MIKLKKLLESNEDDKYSHIGYGRYKLKKDVGPDGKGEKGSPTFKKDKESGDYKKLSGPDSAKTEPKGNKLSGDDFSSTGGLTKEPTTTRDDDEKQDKPKKASHPNSPVGKGGQDSGPESKDDSLGGDHEKEQAVVKGIKSYLQTGENPNLCKVSVPGTNLFCGDNQEVPREKMPQLKSKVVPGGKAEKMVKAGKLETDKDGEVNLEDKFLNSLDAETKETEVDVTKLKATQNFLNGNKISKFMNQLQHGDEDSGFTDNLTKPIIVSKDGYVLDGHHRWAALVAKDMANGGGSNVNMKVKMVDMGIDELLPKSQEFTKNMGLQFKGVETKKESNIVKLKDLLPK